MRRQSLLSLAVLTLVLGLATPALAGGWASVRLDGPPHPAYVEVPWTIDFTIRAHDRTPVNVARTYLTAQHRETGETVTADAEQEGPEGHDVVTVVFPRVGAWKWGITPDPYAMVSFPTLTVLAGPADAAGADAATVWAAPSGLPAHIHKGTCDNLGEVVFPLDDTGTGFDTGGASIAESEFLGSESAAPVAVSEIAVDAKLTELASGDHAITVQKRQGNQVVSLACGDIGGRLSGDALVLGLQPSADSSEADGATGRS